MKNSTCQSRQKYSYYSKSKTYPYGQPPQSQQQKAPTSTYNPYPKNKNVNKSLYLNKNANATSTSSTSSSSSITTSIKKIPSQKSIFIHPQSQSHPHHHHQDVLTPQEEEEEEGLINETFVESNSHVHRPEKPVKRERPINKWLYTIEELQNMKKPCKEYISFGEELVKRAKAAQFVKSVCFKLGLEHHVLATATIFLQRYYVRKSIEVDKYQDIGSACIFLATKLFESKDMRRMSDIIDACAKVSMKNNNYVVQPRIHDTWERNIVHYEMEILQALCFDIDMDLPHTFITKYTNYLKTSRDLKKFTYCIINDCLSSTLCLRYKWDVIVVAAIYVSAKLLNEHINTYGQKNWWSTFSINESNLKNIIKEILLNYQNDIESNIPVSQSQMPSSTSHLNSPPLSNPHPSQTQIVTTPQTLTSELEKRVSSYSSSDQGMIPVAVGGAHQIPPSPTLSETSDSPMEKNPKKRSFTDDSYSKEKIQKKRIGLKYYLKNSNSINSQEQ